MLELRTIEKSRVESWHLRFKSGWAVLTIDEKTGVVSLCSDWGDYMHRWNPAHTGKKGPNAMKEFIAGASLGYLVDKFHYGKHESERYEFDGEATKESIKRTIIQSRISGGISIVAARELWMELKHHIDLDSAEGFMQSIEGTDLDEFLDCSYEYIETKSPPSLLFLMDELLPALQRQLKGELG